MKLCVLVALTIARAFGQDATLANLSCVRSLTVPSYPLIAGASRVQGLVTVRLVVSRAGGIEKQTIEGPQMLTRSMGQNLDAQFDRACEGKTVVIKFQFLVEDDRPVSSNPIEIYRWIAPNTFVISLPPRPIMF
jgi:hypothetical protein